MTGRASGTSSQQGVEGHSTDTYNRHTNSPSQIEGPWTVRTPKIFPDTHMSQLFQDSVLLIRRSPVESRPLQRLALARCARSRAACGPPRRSTCSHDRRARAECRSATTRRQPPGQGHGRGDLLPWAERYIHKTYLQRTYLRKQDLVSTPVGLFRDVQEASFGIYGLAHAPSAS